MSVYDLETKRDEEHPIKKTSSSPSLLESPKSQRKITSRNSLADINDQSTMPTDLTSYLDVDLNNVNEVKQELKIDNNTKDDESLNKLLSVFIPRKENYIFLKKKKKKKSVNKMSSCSAECLSFD